MTSLRPRRPSPYLYGIGGRVLSNQLRSLHRQSRLEEKLRNLGVAPPADPAVLIVQSSRDQEVVAAVNRLKPKDREIVKLYAWEDLPRDIIAEMMGMTRAAIDQFEFRAVGLDGELG
jgi:DNA-directed RNA polymerase specialized sigma24 family protein